MMTSRRVSLPVFRHFSPNRLSPKRFSYLTDISEFEIDPPFISSNGSSSSSADASPRRMLSPLRPSSARPYRRRRKLDRESWTANAFDYDDEDDIFGAPTTHSHSNSPSPQPTYSLRSSPQPPHTNSTSSTNSVHNDQFLRGNDENFNTARNLFVDRYYVEQPPNTDRTIRHSQNQQMRSFNTDQRGRVVDCGFKSGRQSRPLTRNNKNRRATCPEIWLSTADDEEVPPITRCVLRIYGGPNTGKHTMAHQMAAHADITAYQDLNLDYADLNLPVTNVVGFLMNNDEVQLEILQGATAPEEDERMVIYMVLYSIDSRDSFIRAAQHLYRLHQSRRKVPSTPIVLVGNKMDLQRKRRVATAEGRMLAKIYKSGFVEASSLLSMNMDEVWEETLRKFQKHKTARERYLRNLKESMAPKQSNCLMGRIVKHGRRFAKSCEEIVAKLAAL